jgi:hypothetical protein
MNAPRKSLIAAALLLSFGSVMAEGTDPAPTPEPQVVANTFSSSLAMSAERSDTSVTNLTWTANDVVGGESTAATSTNQTTTQNISTNAGNSPNTATLESGAGKNADGNIGINLTAGAGNLQGNSTAIVSNDANDVFATSSTIAKQSTLTNFSFSSERSSNEAIMDEALAGASGNIGVNISAGTGHTQSNQLSMIESGKSKVSRASAVIEQSTLGNTGDNRSEFRSGDSSNVATIMYGALARATGNMGANVAAGVGNAQANSMSVSVVGAMR